MKPPHQTIRKTSALCRYAIHLHGKIMCQLIWLFYHERKDFQEGYVKGNITDQRFSTSIKKKLEEMKNEFIEPRPSGPEVL